MLQKESALSWKSDGQCGGIANQAGGGKKGEAEMRMRQIAIQQISVLVLVLLLFLSAAPSLNASPQQRRTQNRSTQASHAAETMSPEARELVERAIEIACIERRRDPKGSHPIDDMQGRPSLPVQSAEAVAGSERAQRLLPLAKNLTIEALSQLIREYKLSSGNSFPRLQRAIQRVRLVRRIKPDMDSRDNASVLMRNPATITFGTIFLAGLPSDEAMISVLSHELVHIADGDQGTLLPLYRAVGKRASSLTGLSVRNQRAEELTSDLVGAMAAREFVADTPDYDRLPRRISRAVAHNCVEADEGDEDHLSPRETIRALFSLNPSFTRELVLGHEENVRPRSSREN
jgi:hypothetical protein